MVDGLSNFCRFIPLTQKTSSHIKEALFAQWISYFDFPDWILLDGKASFVLQEFKIYMKEHGIDLKISGSYAHFQNGKAERMNRYLGEQLKVMKQIESGSCLNHLSFISMSHNGNWVRHLKMSPYHSSVPCWL